MALLGSKATWKWKPPHFHELTSNDVQTVVRKSKSNHRKFRHWICHKNIGTDGQIQASPCHPPKKHMQPGFTCSPRITVQNSTLQFYNTVAVMTVCAIFFWIPMSWDACMQKRKLKVPMHKQTPFDAKLPPKRLRMKRNNRFVLKPPSAQPSCSSKNVWTEISIRFHRTRRSKQNFVAALHYTHVTRVRHISELLRFPPHFRRHILARIVALWIWALQRHKA